MNIFIIDDHQLFAAGLKEMLSSAFNNAYIECFASPAEAIKRKNAQNPELIILDFYIPGFDPLKYIKTLLHTYIHAKLVVISSSVSATDRKNSLSVGATAYFEKNLPPDVVLAQLKDVINNRAADNIDLSFIKLQGNQYGLGEKKTEILILLARGYSTKEIADHLNISSETVKSHLSDIYRIVHVKNRSEAREWAYQHGFV